MKEKGFTLAEVLITLGIIGIVAAMTLPALINKHEKTVTVNRLKKSYSTISNMLISAQQDHGDVTNWNLSFGELDENVRNILENFVSTYMIPYLNVLNDCGIECKSIPEYKYLNNTTADLNGFYAIFLKDGSILYVALDNDGVNLRSVIMYIDLNGTTRPNIIGKDVFAYYFNESNIKKGNFWGFWGGSGHPTREGLITNSRGCNKNGLGQYCGALIQVDNWEIKDDYPW